MARARLSSDIVGVFKTKITSFPGFAPRLHLLYLINDVLLHSGRAQQDYFGPALQRHIADFCVAACDPQFAGPADVKRVLDLIDIWINKQFYSKDFLEDVKRKVRSATEEPGPAKKQKSDPWAY